MRPSFATKSRTAKHEFNQLNLLSLTTLFIILLNAVLIELSQASENLDDLDTQVSDLLENGEYKKAHPIAEKVLKIRERDLGPKHPHTLGSLNNMASIYQNIGDYQKAKKLYLRLKKNVETVLSPGDPRTAKTFHNLASLYKELREYKKAEPLYLKALGIWEKSLGPKHPVTLNHIKGLASLYRTIGDYKKARQYYEHALKIEEEIYGPDHPKIINSLNSLGFHYYEIGEIAKAEKLYKRALKIVEKKFGSDHDETATVQNKLGMLYIKVGDYKNAKLCFGSALDIWKNTFGSDHPTTASGFNNMGVYYKAIRDFPLAEEFFQRSLSIRKNLLKPEDPVIAWSLQNLAILYFTIGDFDKAELFYKRAISIREKAFGTEHPITADSLNGLADLYNWISDYPSAMELYERVLMIREKVLGSENQDTLAILNNLATIYHKTGDNENAVLLFQRVIKVNEKSLEQKDPSYIGITLGNLARLYLDLGEFKKAEALLKRALEIMEKQLGPMDPHVAMDLMSLGTYYQAIGDNIKAETNHKRALHILETNFGVEHLATAIALNNLALLYIDLDNQKKAQELAAKSEKARLNVLSNVFSFTTEQQRLSYQKSAFPYCIFATTDDASGMALAVLRNKGLVLDSLLEDRQVALASKKPEISEIIDKLFLAKQRLSQLLLEVSTDLGEKGRQQGETKRRRLITEVNQLESDITRKVASLGEARWALSVTIKQLQAFIPKDSLLIEFVRYFHYLGNVDGIYRYGVILLSSKGGPRWISLGDASAIEKNIGTYHKKVRSNVDEKSLLVTLKSLFEQLWTPIIPAIPEEITNVIISPDGEMNFVSFATLLTLDDHFLGEQYAIRYVSSGRDLLRDIKSSDNQQMIIYANPNFASKNSPAFKNIPNGSSLGLNKKRDLELLHFDPLKGTLKEGRSLEEKAKKWNLPVKVFLGDNATETQLRTVHSPRILHLATHGFFMPDRHDEELSFKGRQRGIGGVRPVFKFSPPTNSKSEFKKETTKITLTNPMHRSGFALAGAQNTLKAWQRGEVPPINNDGIIMAAEVGDLKLHGTWLVTLSACDTGLGEARSGEGVMGLRRGFIMAGAKNLLMTLWPVADEETVAIMEDFYETALASGNPPMALAKVQRDWLIKLRNEKGINHAVRIAGPFVINSQGRP